MCISRIYRSKFVFQHLIKLILNQHRTLLKSAGNCSLVTSHVFPCAGSDSCIKQHFVPVKVTLIPFIGFHFSRCSYLLSLLRPHIYEDLELKVSIARLRNEVIYTLKVIWKSLHFNFCVHNFQNKFPPGQ